MQHIVVGAGATLGEALALGNRWDDCPPLISNFARKTWADYSPSPLLDLHLKELGCWEDVPDIRELFYKLETNGVTNVEKFRESPGNTRQLTFDVGDKPPPGYISGLRISVGSSGISSSPQD